jgi:hypothetical protein
LLQNSLGKWLVLVLVVLVVVLVLWWLFFKPCFLFQYPDVLLLPSSFFSSFLFHPPPSPSPNKGGNAYTALLATLHPMAAHHSECLSTLQFANRCRNVTNQPRVNYIEQSQASNEKQKQRMISEIASLKRNLTGAEIRHQQQLVALMAQVSSSTFFYASRTGITR